jgi:hypothetical protein
VSERRLGHEEIEELLGVYALDALDPDEREQVELHLYDCPRCRAEVADHREVAAMLAHGGAPAPEGLWDRIVDSLEETPPAMRLELGDKDASIVPLDTRRRSRSRFGRPAAIASVAAAVLVGALGVEVLHQRDEIDRLSSGAAEQAFVDAVLDPSSREAVLVSPDGTVRARAVATDSGGYLIADDLPALSGGRIYQLWGLSGDKVISLGVLGSDPSIVQIGVDDRIDGLAITDEEEPVEATNNQPVVAGNFA